jgi:hypothetical protein
MKSMKSGTWLVLGIISFIAITISVVLGFLIKALFESMGG